MLTDSRHFGGSVADLQSARDACSLPVLRKDFTVSERDVLDARIMGADCVLLIAAALDEERAGRLSTSWRPASASTCSSRSTTKPSWRLALAAEADDHRRQPARPRHVRGRPRPCRAHGRADPGRRRAGRRERRARRDDAQSLRDAGYDAVLVGESLVTAADPAAAIAELRVG